MYSMASQERSLNEAPTHQDATPSSMESILKELTELRKANQKLNDRLDSVLQRPSAKKSLFGSKSRSVDPSCSDAVRKTYREMKQQREDFVGFMTDVSQI